MISLWWCHVWPSDSLVMFSCMYKIQGTWSPKYNCFTLNKSLLMHNRGLKLNWIVIKNNHLKASCFLTFSFQNWFFFYLFFFSFFYLFILWQSLATKLVIALTTTLLNIFLLEVNFDKSTIGLYLLIIFSMLAKFLEN